MEDIYNYPLKESAIAQRAFGIARLNRQLRSGIKDEQLANMVVSLWLYELPMRISKLETIKLFVL